MIATKIYVTLNHFETDSKFNLIFLIWLLFMYSVCSVPAIGLYYFLLL
jgi:hypothetical protein